MKTRLIFLLAVLIFLSFHLATAQYFGERVMEKSFEHVDFFFTPYRLVPFGIGTFKSAVVGVLDDPLLDLNLNPAYLFHDSVQTNYVYLDFRSAREVTTRQNVYYPRYDIYLENRLDDRVRFPYPAYFINTRREVEPVLSAAYLFKPSEGPLRGFAAGATYQRISQDQKYYPIPQDIYKSIIGADYLGIRSAAAENIPIVDRYSGTDEMHVRGDLFSLFVGYTLTPELNAGIKAGRVLFSRAGSFGSQNLWEYYYSTSSTSLWRNGEARSQSYAHWEVIGGVNYTFAPTLALGVHGGALWGDVSQALTRTDSSYYGYGPIGSTTQSWSVWTRSGNQQQLWDHEGKTSLFGVNIRSHANERQRFQLHYTYARQHIDLSLTGIIYDTSYGRSWYRWDTTDFSYNSQYRLWDDRNGSGTTIGTTHLVTGSLHWQLAPNLKTFLGLLYERRVTETNTNETVLSDRFSRYRYSGGYPWNYLDSTAEAKTLTWAFSARLKRLTLPIYFTIRTSKVVELLFGLSRTMSEWRAEDVTLAIFRYRVQANRDTVVRRSNYGERYTQPPENISEVRTSLLAGATLTPSPLFHLRLLVTPTFVDTYGGAELTDWQVWFAFNLMP